MEVYARDRGARDPQQDCGISDISSYDMGSPYLVLSKEGSTPDGGHVEVEVEEEGTDEDDEQDSKYPGPTAWIDVEEGEMAEAAESLVKVFTKLLDDEDALLRQMASAAAPAPADETLRDPLGLGAIDPSTLKLVAQEPLAQTSRRFTNFANVSRISRSYTQKPPDTEKNSSLRDLEVGMNALETDLSKRTGQLKRLVKENFERFISCKNTIDDVYTRLHKSEADNRGVNTSSLRTSLSQVQTDAQQSFSPMLERNQKVQQIKSVMGVIKRFQSAFDLPSRIRHFVENQEYPQAVSEYKRAKAILSGSEVSTWNKLYAEAEKGVEDMCKILVEGLENPDLDPDCVEEFAAQVMQLQNELLPAAQGIKPVELWLTSVEQHTHDEIHSITRQHLAKLSVLSHQKRRPTPIGSGNLHSSGEKEKILMNIQQCWVDHVSRLCKIVLQYVPSVWRVGTSENLKEIADLSPSIMSSISASLKVADRVCDEIMDEFYQKVQESVNALLSNQGLLPVSMFAVLKTLRSTASDQMANKGPSRLTNTLQTLLKESHAMCGSHLCGYLRQQVAGISGWEDWKVVLGSRKSGFASTSVPKKLATAVREIMDQCVLLRKEQNQHPQTPDGVSIAALQASFFECFETFATAVESQAANTVNESKDDSPTAIEVTSVSQLLILAGNCRYVRNRVLPDLAMEYEGMINFRLGGNTSGTTKISVAEAHFRELEDLLISSYTKEVKKRLDQLVEQSLADKKSPAKPGDILGVSNNPVEWVHYIIGIQAEVYEFAPCKLHTIVTSVALYLVDAIRATRSDGCYLGFHIQLYLDASFLEASLAKFQSQKMDEAWDAVYEYNVGKIMECISDAQYEGEELFGQKLDPSSGALELDKQLHSICRDVLKKCIHKMGTNVSCLGIV